jgi:hypothetical protein
MLERNSNKTDEGSDTMLFQLLKSLLMILPQSTCYKVLRNRLVSVSRFRQSTIVHSTTTKERSNIESSSETTRYVARINQIRNMHCSATWRTIRQGSLELSYQARQVDVQDKGDDRHSWLGYASKEEHLKAEDALRNEKKQTVRIEDVSPGYHDIASATNPPVTNNSVVVPSESDGDKVALAVSMHESEDEDEMQWKQYWTTADK